MVSPPASVHAVHLRRTPRCSAGWILPNKQIGRRAVPFRQLGLKIGEHVEVRAQRLAVVHVGRVFAFPEKGLAGHALQAFQVDALGGQQIHVFAREIVPHHRHDLDRSKVAGRQSYISGGPAQHAVHFAMRRFHAVVRHRTHHHERHRLIVASGRRAVLAGDMYPA
jgi:hypothetical protein